MLPSGKYHYLPVALQRELEECDRALCSVVDALISQQLDMRPPPILYQYTNAKGMRGILSSGALWLSDVLEQNDPSEVYHGVQLGAKALTTAARKEQHPAAKLFAQRFAENQRAVVKGAARFYVACFSRAHDDLGQWRAYGGNGRGFALGFRASALESAFNYALPQNNSTISHGLQGSTLA